MHVQSTACLDEKRLCSGTSLWVLFPGPPRLGTRILIFNRLCHWEYTQFLLYNAHRQALELCDNSCTHCDLQNVKSTRTCCIAHGTLLNVMWQPGWKWGLGEDGFMYMCGWIPSLFMWNYHNTVNWLWTRNWKLLSHVQLFGNPQTIESMEFATPEYWSR